jgi:hypothetical protein
MAASATELERWQSEIQSGDPRRVAKAARSLAAEKDRLPEEWVFTIHDKWWERIGESGGDLMEASGTDPRNKPPQATLKHKGSSPLIGELMECRKTLRGVTVEMQGMRHAFYVNTHSYAGEKAATTGTANCIGIWDILNYLIIWPSWFLPIQAQPFSHAVFFGQIVTVIENMISECALRIQSGIWEFVNNALSLNPDMRAWFGTVLQAVKRDGLSIQTFLTMLKTPIYVVRTNPFSDSSPLVAKTVRMESCATVIQELTKSYGVDVRVDLWLPAGLNGKDVDDPQPDRWANLSHPTYVVTVKDRTNIRSKIGGPIGSALKTVVDLGGALGGIFDPLINEVKSMPGRYESPALGVYFDEPYAIMIAPDDGQDGTVTKFEVIDHTPKAWQMIIGGKSPKWLNDLINATLAWLIDSIMIVIGFTGVPSNILDGFLNDAFLAFQLLQHYGRRDEMGPYHPNIEQFRATNAPPYNVEALFTFLSFLWDTRGYTSAQVWFRNGEFYTYGRDIMRGGLVSLVYWHRLRMITDYVENVAWRFSPTERDVMLQVGDGSADEPPIARIQALITGIQEGINVVTLAPQS